MTSACGVKLCAYLLFDIFSVNHSRLPERSRLLWHTSYKWSLRLSAINLTNKVALYNFLSTFSGTHYVTPRAISAEIGFHF